MQLRFAPGPCGPVSAWCAGLRLQDYASPNQCASAAVGYTAGSAAGMPVNVEASRQVSAALDQSSQLALSDSSSV